MADPTKPEAYSRLARQSSDLFLGELPPPLQNTQFNPSIITSEAPSNPSKSSQTQLPSIPQIQAPSTYNAALHLTSELDPQRWWIRLVDLLKTVPGGYHAARVSLALPHDPDDLSGTPWAIKAVYNGAGTIGSWRSGDSLQGGSTTITSSVGKEDRLGRGGGGKGGEKGKEEETSEKGEYCQNKPGIGSSPRLGSSPMTLHHIPLVYDTLQSFDQTPDPLIDNDGVQRVLRRGKTVVVAREYRKVQGSPLATFSSRAQGSNTPTHSSDSASATKLKNDMEDAKKDREAFKKALMNRMISTTFPSAASGSSGYWENTGEQLRSIDHNTMWGNVIDTPALYCLEEGRIGTYFEDFDDSLVDTEANFFCNKDGSNNGITESQHNFNDGTTSTSGFFRDYEEYEQAAPSPWSQSPAPSPAIMDTEINPFFQSVPTIDDDAFNPSSNSPLGEPGSGSYTHKDKAAPYPPPKANVHSIVHVPLVHPGMGWGIDPLSASANSGPPPQPIAILSFLSVLFPYPQELIVSISHLAPFIASSLSCSLQHALLMQQVRFQMPQTRRHHNTHHHHQRHQHHREHKPPLGERSATGDSIITTGSVDTVIPEPTSDPVTPTQTPTPTLSQPGKMAGKIPGVPPTPTGIITPKWPEKEYNDNNDGNNTRGSPVIETISSDEEGSIESSGGAGLFLYTEEDENGAEYTRAMSESGKPSRFSSSTEPLTITPRKSKSTPITTPTIPVTSPRQRKPVSFHHRGHRHQRSKHFTTAPTHFDVNLEWFGRGFEELRGGLNIKESAGILDTVIPLTPHSKLLRVMIDAIPIHVFTLDLRSGRITWLNRRGQSYTGQSLSAMVGGDWTDLVHLDDAENIRMTWREAFERGHHYSMSCRLRRFDGIYRWFLVRCAPLRDGRGRVVHWFMTMTDAHEQKIAQDQSARQAEIEASEKKYRLLAEAIPQIVFTLTTAGLTYCNDKWPAYSGQPFELARGLGFMEHVHPEDRSRCKLPEPPAAQKETDVGDNVETEMEADGEFAWQDELRLLGRDKQYRWFLVKCISVEAGEDGRKWFGTCTDINDHKLVEIKLNEAKEAAMRSTESKTRFLSNMSHEIRTPLIGITGMVDFMLDTDLTLEQLDFAHTIQQSAESLLYVINDILDFSKVEAGMMRLQMEPFSVAGILEDVNELLSTVAIHKGIELSFWVESDVPEVLIGDRVRLRQVLLNLIGNALKFTNIGEVHTRCSVRSRDYETDKLTAYFEVIDTGFGFDAAEEAHMFKPFSQVDSSTTRKHGGSGLGLVISRQLIELHGGEMRCVSKKGEGSTFYFTVKFNVPPPGTNIYPRTPEDHHPAFPFPTAPKRGSFNDSLARHVAAATTRKRPSSEYSSLSTNSSISTPPSSIGSRSGLNSLQEPFTNNEFSAPGEQLSVDMSAEPAEDDSSSKNEPVPSLAIKTNPHVLVVSEWPRSTETSVNHVKYAFRNSSSPDIDVALSYTEAQDFLTTTSETNHKYNFLLINLASQTEVLSLASIVKHSPIHAEAMTIIITTPVQRAGIMEGAQGEFPMKCEFVFKPLKRSKLEHCFDEKVHTTSMQARRMTIGAHMTGTQKEVFSKMERDIGGKGYRVLLVEDNLVNQKVMNRYLQRVGLEVVIADDGQECLDKFYAHPHKYFSLILCDLFMPVKDGYDTTRELRSWEAKNLGEDEEQIPIIALSANVMSDVAEKCIETGFTDYISKPVNFAALSEMIRGYLLARENT